MPNKGYKEKCRGLTPPSTNSVFTLIKGGFRLESITAEWVPQATTYLGYPAATMNCDRAVVHITRSLARGFIFFTGTVSSNRGLTWACWGSGPGVCRGAVVVVGAL